MMTSWQRTISKIIVRDNPHSIGHNFIKNGHSDVVEHSLQPEWLVLINKIKINSEPLRRRAPREPEGSQIFKKMLSFAEAQKITKHIFFLNILFSITKIRIVCKFHVKRSNNEVFIAISILAHFIRIYRDFSILALPTCTKFLIFSKVLMLWPPKLAKIRLMDAD